MTLLPPRTSRRALRAVSAFIVASAVLGIGGAAAAHGATGGAVSKPSGPSLQVPVHPVRLGATVAIVGSRWTPKDMVAVQLCGADARDGSTDCASSSAADVMVWPDGSLHANLRITRPPAACPCVVVAASIAGAQTHARAIRVTGVPLRALPPATHRSQVVAPQVVAASLEGGKSWLEWFGATAHRTLVLTVRNPSGTAVPVSVEARKGASANATSFAGNRVIPDLASGQQRTVTIPVSFAPFSIGTIDVSGTVTAPTGTARFDTDDSTGPWGLIALAIVLVLLLCMMLVLRRRSRRRRPPVLDGDEPDDQGDLFSDLADPTAIAPAAEAVDVHSRVVDITDRALGIDGGVRVGAPQALQAHDGDAPVERPHHSVIDMVRGARPTSHRQPPLARRLLSTPDRVGELTATVQAIRSSRSPGRRRAAASSDSQPPSAPRTLVLGAS